MRKVFLSAMFIGMVGVAKAQWVFKKVDNGFDTPFRIAYTNSNNLGYLKMEQYDGKVLMFLKGLYFCEENVTCDVSLFVNNEWQKYSYTVGVSSDNNIVWLVNDMTTDKTFLAHFCNATKIKIRVNMIDCDTEIYEFPMGNSSRAYQFMKEGL